MEMQNIKAIVDNQKNTPFPERMRIPNLQLNPYPQLQYRNNKRIKEVIDKQKNNIELNKKMILSEKSSFNPHYSVWLREQRRNNANSRHQIYSQNQICDAIRKMFNNTPNTSPFNQGSNIMNDSDNDINDRDSELDK